MKESLLLKITFVFTAFLFFTKTNHAQTLTCQTSCPQAGEVFSMRTASHVLNTAGANQVWNFSSLYAFPGTHLISYNSASSVPASSLYPQATLVRTNGNSTVFLSSDNTGLRTLHTGTASVNIEPMELPLPFAYGDTYTETIISTSVVGTDTFVINSQNTFSAHGSGTLILPSGTFNDVLAIKFMSIKTTIKNGVATGYVLTNRSHYYYSQNISHPLLYTRFLSETGLVDYLPYTEFISQIGTGLKSEEELNTKLLIAPNPASDQVDIQFLDNTEGKVFLKNSIGQQLLEQDYKGGSCKLNLNGLPEGLYIISFVSGINTINKKIIVSR